MKVAGSTALVTGANRGLGLAFVEALVEMEAAKVYAAARNPQAITLKGVVPLKLDVTSDEDAVAGHRLADAPSRSVSEAHAQSALPAIGTSRTTRAASSSTADGVAGAAIPGESWRRRGRGTEVP